MANAIEESQKSIQSTAIEMSNLIVQVELGATSTETAIPKIKEQLNSLYTDTYENLTKERDLILYALAQSVQTAEGAAKEHLETYMQTTNAIYNNTTVALEKLRAEIERDIEAGNIPTDKINTFLELSGEGALSADKFRTSLENLNLSDIDWGDTDQATKAIESVSTVTGEALQSLDEYYEGLESAIQSFKEKASTPDQLLQLDKMLEFFQNEKSQRIDEIKSSATEFLTNLQKDIIKSSQEQVEKAVEEWDTMSWLQKLWYGNDVDNYIQESMQLYKSNVVDPLTNKMKETFTESLGEDAVWADKAMGTLLASLFSPQGSIFGPEDSSSQYAEYITKFAREIGGAVKQTLSPEMENAAHEAAQGFANGIEINTPLAADAMKMLATGENGILSAFEMAMDSHSPSKEMVKRGLWAMEGLAQGISDNAHLVTGALESLTGQMTEAMTQVAQQMASAFKGALLQAVQALSMDTAWSQNIVNTLLSAIFTPGGMGMMGGGMMGSMSGGSQQPVSYTHLDVYKRQVSRHRATKIKFCSNVLHAR